MAETAAKYYIRNGTKFRDYTHTHTCNCAHWCSESTAKGPITSKGMWCSQAHLYKVTAHFHTTAIKNCQSIICVCSFLQLKKKKNDLCKVSLNSPQVLGQNVLFFNMETRFSISRFFFFFPHFV